MIWGHIISYDQHSLPWIDELLRRSEPSLLDFGSRIQFIILSDRYDSELGVSKLVLNHTPRLRVFSLEVKVSCWGLVRTRFLSESLRVRELVILTRDRVIAQVV
jgi:hypothetical protein